MSPGFYGPAVCYCRWILTLICGIGGHELAGLARIQPRSRTPAVTRTHNRASRFESPQLHQEVRRNSRGFPTPKIVRRYRGFERLARVCASDLPTFPASRGQTRLGVCMRRKSVSQMARETYRSQVVERVLSRADCRTRSALESVFSRLSFEPGLNALKTAACVERNFCAFETLHLAFGPGCSSIATAHAGAQHSAAPERPCKQNWPGHRSFCFEAYAGSSAGGLSPNATHCSGQATGRSVMRLTPNPRGSRPSVAAMTRVGRRKARDKVMRIERSVFPSRAASASIV